MARKVSTVHKRLTPAAAKKLSEVLKGVAMDSAEGVNALSRVGVIMSDFAAQSYAQAYGMDAAVTIPGLTVNPGQSMSPYIQFLQTWLPGQVQVVTQARKADQLFGVTTVGSWEDEEIIQEILELVGVAQPYSDLGNIPLSSWNLTYEKRGVVRFEEGFSVGELEGLRSGRIGVNASQTKRNAASLALEIARNRVAFYGFNGATDYPVYGALNDVNLPVYASLPSGKLWTVASRAEIVADLLFIISTLRKNSKEVVDPTTAAIKLVIASDVVDYLNTPSGTGAEMGETAGDWLKKNYPNVTIESAVEFNKANGGANVLYAYAESIGDSGTDGGGVIEQLVPTRFRALGVDTSCKVVTEDFTNATSGVLVKRPFAVFRGTGI